LLHAARAGNCNLQQARPKLDSNQSDSSQLQTLSQAGLLHVARPSNCNMQQPGSAQVSSPPGTGNAQQGSRPASGSGLFCFSAPPDPANEAEALHERAAIMAVENGWDAARALQEARCQAQQENRWRAFLRNAQRVLQAPESQRRNLLGIYQVEAARRYGDVLAREMAQTLRLWIERMVH
jgi:hypothetical protein